MPERPPHACPAWPARAHRDEARANAAVARKPPGAVEAYLCDPDNPAGHWHIRGVPKARSRAGDAEALDQLRAVVLDRLRAHGRVDRATLRDAAADIYGAEKKRPTNGRPTGGGRRSSDMLRRALVDLETAGVLVRDGDQVVAVDEAALQAS